MSSKGRDIFFTKISTARLSTSTGCKSFKSSSSSSETSASTLNSSESESESESDFSDFLVVSCSVGYLLLIIPFRFKITPNNNYALLHTNKMQQVLCGIAHLLTLYQYLTEIRRFPYHRLNKEPANYFRCSQRIVSFLYHAMLVLVLWKDGRKFLKVVNICKNSTLSLPASHRSKLLAYACKFIYIGTSLICLFLGYNIISTEDLSPPWLLRRYAAEARYNFFLEGNTSSSWAPPLAEISTLDVFLVVVTFFMQHFRNLFAIYSDGIILMTCLTLWQPCVAFSRVIAREIREIEAIQIQAQAKNQKSARGVKIFTDVSKVIFGVSQVLENYKGLKKLSIAINKVMSTVILFFVLECILFYATSLNVLFVTKDKLARGRFAVFFVNSVVAFTCFGDMCQQVDLMLEWLSMPILRERISGDELAILLNELRVRKVGISANIFILDYPSIFNIIGAFVTYFIICAAADEGLP